MNSADKELQRQRMIQSTKCLDQETGSICHPLAARVKHLYAFVLDSYTHSWIVCCRNDIGYDYQARSRLRWGWRARRWGRFLHRRCPAGSVKVGHHFRLEFLFSRKVFQVFCHSSLMCWGEIFFMWVLAKHQQNSRHILGLCLFYIWSTFKRLMNELSYT